MKTVIACTDFSLSSINACKYSALLAQKLNCTLTLFNMIESPFIHSNVGLYGLTYSVVKNTSHNKLKKIVDELSKLFPKIKIYQFISINTFKESLENFNLTHQVEAAVMGLETKNTMTKFIFGTHGVDIAGKINAPVIIIPQTYKTHKLSKILLAVDNTEKLKQSSLKKFELFVKKTKVDLSLLHIETEDQFYDTPIINTLKVNNKKLSIKTFKAKDIQNGVKEFSNNSKTDMVAIISKKHSAFYNLFIETNTKKIAFASKIPVMAIHE